jgi:hypothetical protein
MDLNAVKANDGKSPIGAPKFASNPTNHPDVPERTVVKTNKISGIGGISNVVLSVSVFVRTLSGLFPKWLSISESATQALGRRGL